MDNPRVLVGAPVYQGSDYCMKDFLTRIKSLSYGNYDIFLVDNSDSRDYSKKLEKEYGVDVLHLNLKGMIGMKKIVRCRNRIFSYAVQEGYDYVLMMDSDVIPPVDIIESLLSYKKDVVGGLYYGVFNVDGGQKMEAVAWKFLTEEEWEEVKGQLKSSVVKKREDIRRHLTKEEIESGELQEIVIGGAGCLLVSRDIFSRFKYGLLDVPGKISTGDDIYFFRKLREAGVKIFCDVSVVCDHLTEGKFGEDGIHPLHK